MASGGGGKPPTSPSKIISLQVHNIMAFKRRSYGGRKRTYRKRKPQSAMSRYGGYARSAFNLARQVWKLKGLVNSEMLKHDIAVNSSVDLASALRVNLQGIAQGDSASGRTGNSIFVRSFNFDGLLYRGTSGDVVQEVRVSIVMDTQQLSDTAPTTTDIYVDQTPTAKLNPNTVGRFKILWSKQYVLDTVKTLSSLVKINLPMRHHIRYNGTGVDDVQRGGLWMIVSSTQGSANFPTIQGSARLSYHDN